MKFPKCINKKMIIFVILFSAFLYFSGSFNVMREGLYSPSSSALKATNMKCSNCLSNSSALNSQCSDECKTFIRDNNINSKKYKAQGLGLDTFFEPLPPKIWKGNCTGCQLVSNPNNLPCDTGQYICRGSGAQGVANAKDYNCIYDQQLNKTTCTPK